MPIFVHGVMLIDEPPPCCQPMVSLLDEEHLTGKVSKVGVILEHEIEIFIGLMP